MPIWDMSAGSAALHWAARLHARAHALDIDVAAEPAFFQLHARARGGDVAQAQVGGLDLLQVDADRCRYTRRLLLDQRS
jgi:hypothetical protein